MYEEDGLFNFIMNNVFHVHRYICTVNSPELPFFSITAVECSVISNTFRNEKGLKRRIRDTEELRQYHTNIFIQLQLAKDVVLHYL